MLAIKNGMPRFYIVTFKISFLQDGYQQNFKRGSGQSGPRGAPRGNFLISKYLIWVEWKFLSPLLKFCTSKATSLLTQQLTVENKLTCL